MGRYGDDVLQYIQDVYGELPKPAESGMACFYLSIAVETWALGAHSQLEDLPDEEAA